MTTPSLPNYARLMRDGYKHQRESALLRSDMESGPPRQARIKSTPMVTKTCTIYLGSKVDFESFEDWYVNELKEGALWFTYLDPVSESTKMARFVGGGYEATPRANIHGSWLISAKIESWGS